MGFRRFATPLLEDGITYLSNVVRESWANFGHIVRLRHLGKKNRKLARCIGVVVELYVGLGSTGSAKIMGRKQRAKNSQTPDFPGHKTFDLQTSVL